MLDTIRLIEIHICDRLAAMKYEEMTNDGMSIARPSFTTVLIWRDAVLVNEVRFAEPFSYLSLSHLRLYGAKLRVLFPIRKLSKPSCTA